MANNMILTDVPYKTATPGISYPGSMLNCKDKMRTGALNGAGGVDYRHPNILRCIMDI